jgi:hypothetical protein
MTERKKGHMKDRKKKGNMREEKAGIMKGSKYGRKKIKR